MRGSLGILTATVVALTAGTRAASANGPHVAATSAPPATAVVSAGGAMGPVVTRAPRRNAPADLQGRVRPSSYFANDAVSSDAAATRNAGGGSCDVCDDCCCEPCCDICYHYTGVFADFLYLQAREVDMVYARPQDGVDLFTAVPVGEVGVADPDYQPGFRLGFSYALTRCSSVVAAYSHYESQTSDSITTTAPNVIRSFLHHPGTVTSLEHIGLAATANYDLDFQIADVDYRRLYAGGRNYQVNYSLGVRYAHLEQDFNMVLSRAQGDSLVSTAIDFDGAGFKVGIDGERKAPCSGLFVYGRGYASALAGHFTSAYDLSNAFAGVLATTGWDDDRVVPILEYELGAGWQSYNGRLRVSAGYTMAAWCNVITTGEWINTVQTNDYTDINDTIIFEGLTSRVEVRW